MSKHFEQLDKLKKTLLKAEKQLKSGQDRNMSLKIIEKLKETIFNVKKEHRKKWLMNKYNNRRIVAKLFSVMTRAKLYFPDIMKLIGKVNDVRYN